MSIEQLYFELSNKIPGFKARNNQLQMILAIDSCFNNLNINARHNFEAQENFESTKKGDNICLIEAPTGTGKSFAYLLAGIYHAKKQAKTLIISTATKTLQAQLFKKDLPQFVGLYDKTLVYALAKGRSNYLCPLQLELSLSEAKNDILKQSLGVTDVLSVLNDSFNTGSWDGDLDNAEIAIASEIKPLLTMDRHQCLNYSCPYNQKDNHQCPYYNKREFLKKTDIIVTNHSLLLTDMDMGSGSVLPYDPSEYLLCIDEAHNFNTYALKSFSSSFQLKSSVQVIDNLANLIKNKDNATYIFEDVILAESVYLRTLGLKEVLDKLLILVASNLNLFTEDKIILNDYLNPKIGDGFNNLFIELAVIAYDLLTKLTLLEEAMKAKNKTQVEINLEVNLSKLGFYISQVELINQTITYLLNQDESKFNATSKYLMQTRYSNEEEYIFCASLVHVGAILEEKLWSKVSGAILTSATLAIGDSFKHLKFLLGLNNYTKLLETKLDSEFNFNLQGQLAIPKFQNSPDFKNKDAFNRELIIYLRVILNYELAFGSLVLFFNKEQLQLVFKYLPAKLQNLILIQSEFSSTAQLLKLHKEKIDEGIPSIIFGLNSFAEGVDLPGKYCMHVIITKLPFETHKDPHNLVREYWVQAEKGNYFMEIAMPEVAIKLIQAVGRLIRTEDDYGQVTLCDNRVILKQYGNILLKSLPNFNRKYNPEFLNLAFSKINLKEYQ